MNMSVVGSVCSFINFNKEERTFRAGANAGLAAGMQALSVSYALAAIKEYEPARQLFGKILNLDAKKLGIPFVGIALMINAKAAKTFIEKFKPEQQNNIYYKIYSLIHLAISNIEAAMDSHFWLRRSVYILHDNIGTLAQMALIAVSAGVMTSSGGVFIGAAMASLLVTDMLSQRGLLGFSVRTRFYPMINALSIMAQLLGGNYFEKAYALSQIGMYAYMKYKELPFHFPPVEGQKVKAIILNEEQLHSISINDNHVRPIDLPPEPKIDLSKTLREMYAPITLDRKYLFLQAERDEHLLKEIRKGTLQFKTDDEKYEDLKKYIDEGLNKFVNRIVHRQITEGEPTSFEHYRTLLVMAKSIAVALQKQDPLIQHDTLIALGLAGHYCGSGFFREVEGRYQVMVDFNSKTLQGKFLAGLRMYRDTIFQNWLLFFQKMGETRGKRWDVDDVHVYNQSIVILGKHFGLSSFHGALADHGIQDSILNKFFRDVMDRLIEKKLGIAPYKLMQSIVSSNYNVENICLWLETDLNKQTGSIVPFKMLKDWYVDWLSDRLSKSRKDAETYFAQQILKDKEYNIDGVTIQGITIERSYLLLLLIELGIFKVPVDSTLLV